jgi:acyl-CoA synthetase (NDP forming)
MGCINKLTAAVSYDCTNVANRAKSGLEAKAVLINKSDIDLTTLTQSAVTSMLLTSGKLVLMLVD